MVAKSKQPNREAKVAEQEDKFVAEYFAAGCNAALAYSRTFPKSSAASSRSSAAVLLARPSVRAKIAAEKRRLRTTVTATGLPVTGERIVAELADIAFADPADVFDFTGDGVPGLRPAHRIPPHARRAIQSIEVTTVPRGKGQKPVVKAKVKWHDKGRAATQLAGILDLFTERSPELLLEKLFAGLPAAVADGLRQALVDRLRHGEADEAGARQADPLALSAPEAADAGVPVAGEEWAPGPMSQTSDIRVPGKGGDDNATPLFDDP